MLCKKACGFFGSRSTMNLCSKCYKDVVLNVARDNVLPTPPVETAVKKCEQDVHGADSGYRRETHEAESECQHILIPYANKCGFFGNSGTINLCSKCSKVVVLEPASGESQAPNRCSTCKKRVGLTGFKCRCGRLLCANHRYPDKHNCSFDFKAMARGREAIAKANPVFRPDKVQKR